MLVDRGHICGMYLGALLRCLFGYLIWVVYRGDLQRVEYILIRLLGLRVSSIWCVMYDIYEGML